MCVKIIKIRLKEVIFYSFAFQIQNFAQFVENFAKTCICVSATFRNSAKKILKNSSINLKIKWSMTILSLFLKDFFHAWESTAFKVPLLPNTILLYLTTIIRNLSVLPTSISEISCIRSPTDAQIRGDRSSPDHSLATMQLISQIEVGKTDIFLMIVVKHNSIVFGSTRTLNAVDSHAWNWLKSLDV